MVICSGMVNTVSAEQPLNWETPITALFKVTLTRDVQFSKTDVPIVVTVLGTETAVKPEQP